MADAQLIRLGTAGWAIGRDVRACFPATGSSLERYATLLNCAEINSTFYRLPRMSTAERWVGSVQEDFRFSLKMPKSVTHENFSQPSRQHLQAFFSLREIFANKAGPVLVQLPPRRLFEAPSANAFFCAIRELYPEGQIALEPRHPTWFSAEADAVRFAFGVSRVIADPSPVAVIIAPVSAHGLIYRRLHGSPRVYYSSYSKEELTQISKSMAEQSPHVSQWCIFDNTASGAALANALTLVDLTSSNVEV